MIGHAKKGTERIYDQHEYRDERQAALEEWARELNRILGNGSVAKHA